MSSSQPWLSRAEASAAALLSSLAWIVVAAYFLDRVGLAFTPARMLPVAILSAAASAWWLWRGGRSRPADFVWIGVFAAVWSWLMWLARPRFLPLGTGPDLTHHLLLIDFIERHWTLVHEPQVEWWLGEMVQYTPGSHTLIALAGAWTGRDGLHALHPFVAATVALKFSFVFLVTLRLLPESRPGVRVPLAIAGIATLGLALPYALGSFAHDSFIAQAVAELFIVGMWWALAAWDAAPGFEPMLLFALFGAAAFLTWPVLVGAPLVAAAVVVLARDSPPFAVRVRHAALAALPVLAVAALYFVGRIGWLAIVRTGGNILHPSAQEYTWTFLGLSVAGAVIAAGTRPARTTVVFGAAALLEAAALFAAARTRGTETPYMALKMFYLLVYPQCVLAALALAAGAGWASRRIMHTTTAPVAAWAIAAAITAASLLHARGVLARPLSTPAISEPVAQAGLWAREHVPASCVEYLVGDTNTAYWLHLASLGNRRMSARTGDPSTFELRDSLVRWLTPGGLPYAIADRQALPADVSRELDVVADFGSAVVARRRGAASCANQ